MQKMFKCVLERLRLQLPLLMFLGTLIAITGCGAGSTDVVSGCAGVSSTIVTAEPGSLTFGTAQGNVVCQEETASNINGSPLAMVSCKGIPYATPPVGSLRFSDPVDPPLRGSDLTATAFGNVCAQTASGTPVGSEDCLYLNVYRPKGVGPFPVMVWIHGGAFIIGSGSEAGYNLPGLVREGVIVVTFNYRMGLFGFLDHAALGGDPGNYGIKDQQQAMRWVRANIHNFGGDPNNVTIFGESAGGHSVLTHLACPTSACLFQKAISHSGSYNPTQMTRTVARMVYNPIVSAVLGCTGTDSEVLACLRGKTRNELLTAIGSFWPVPDTETTFLPEASGTRIASGNFNKVPVMIGSNRDEHRYFMLLDFSAGRFYESDSQYRDTGIAGLIASDARIPAGLKDGIADFYLNKYAGVTQHKYRLALADAGGDFRFNCNDLRNMRNLYSRVPTYSYWFADQTAGTLTTSPTPAPDTLTSLILTGATLSYAALDQNPFRMKATHSFEIQYVFGTVGAKGGTAAQQALSNNMLKYWAQFAKNGNPTFAGATVSWPAFASTNGSIMRFNPEGPMVVDADAFSAIHNCNCWNGIWDNGNMNSCTAAY